MVDPIYTIKNFHGENIKNFHGENNFISSRPIGNLDFSFFSTCFRYMFQVHVFLILLSMNVDPIALSNFVESSTISTNNLTNDSATLDIAWEKTMVSLKFEVPTQKLAADAVLPAGTAIFYRPKILGWFGGGSHIAAGKYLRPRIRHTVVVECVGPDVNRGGTVVRVIHDGKDARLTNFEIN